MGSRTLEARQQERIFYVVLGRKVLARYLEQERAERFVEHYNLMDGAASASVAVVDYVATPPVDRSPGSESFVIFEVLLLPAERVVKRFFSRRRAERFAAEYNRREGETTAYALPRFAVYAESEVLA